MITLLGVCLLAGGAACLAGLAADRYAPSRMTDAILGASELGDTDDDIEDQADSTDADDGDQAEQDADEDEPEDYDEIEGLLIQDGEPIDAIDIDFPCDVDDAWAEADW